MPRYRTELGVVVNIPQEKAARIGGLIPVDAAPPAPRKVPARKATSKGAATPTSES